MDGEQRIGCTLDVVWTRSNGDTVRRQQGKKAALALGRDDDRRVVLHFQAGKGAGSEGAVVLQGGVVLHTRMLAQGLATIRCVSQLISVFISGADPTALREFLRILADKLPSGDSRQPGSGNSTAPRPVSGPSSISTRVSFVSSGGNTGKAQQQEAAHVAALVEGPLRVRLPGNLTEISPARPDAKCPDSPSPTAKRLKQMSYAAPPKPRQAVSLDDLNSEQRRVYDLVMGGKSVFFSGGAGTGKSFLLRKILDSLPLESTVATGPTGVAACHIGGMTLHAFAGLRPDGTPPRDANKLRLWQTTKVLILDEISMVSGTFFDQIESVARCLKNPKLPFGGLQLVVCGDFFQLPPVNKDGQLDKDFCFLAKSWARALPVQVELRHVFRQQDPRFVATLNRIRVGRPLPSDVLLLQATSTNTAQSVFDALSGTQATAARATQLCTHVHESNAINAAKLSELPGALHKFVAVDVGCTETLNRMARSSPMVFLKEGAQVLLNKNLDVRGGLVNGSRGLVMGFNAAGLPLIKFGNRDAQVLYMDDITVTDHRGKHTRKQLPVDLGYAISIHKSQGMTLDFVDVNLSNTFECGQAYVALSRARSLEGLRVRGFSLQCVRADAKVQHFYDALADLSL